MKEESLSLARAAIELHVPLSSIYRWRADANLPDLSAVSSEVAKKAKNHPWTRMPGMPDARLDTPIMSSRPFIFICFHLNFV